MRILEQLYFIIKLGGMCLHQVLEWYVGTQGSEKAPEGHVARGIGPCTVRVKIGYMAHDVSGGSSVERVVSVDFGS